MRGIIENAQIAGFVYLLVTVVFFMVLLIITKRLGEIRNSLKALVELQSKRDELQE